MRTGRPRQFDRDEAVRQAMHLFWENGYDATSLSQLKAAIGRGITAPSFYAAFGSKEKLYKETVACYLHSHGRVTDALWDDTLPPRQAIETTLLRSARMQCETGHPKGCMVALGVMSANSEEHRHLLAPLDTARARTREGFIRCVKRGVENGELHAGASPDTLGLVFNSFLFGISTLARDGVPLSIIETSVRQIMALWETFSVKNGNELPNG
ncbi:TetR family transcriptional regulator [Chimaeribacter californicus]|uniref:TetR family transcriptional regulator n=1 Tax=Chimaeribacter californicus TaxID=2060067 RepID=A0A2N5DW72_9GAMM|nr:TetR/AcrR family transcriptional regulator [Chimaeribacter californicus]PLR31428.1 TetR family transcriptional regulator [Chimaeribacter californicus]